MTFTQIVNEVLGRMNLSTTDATTRIGSAVNRHYKRVTSELGMDATRFVTRNATTTNGVQTLTFDDIEKIDRVIDGTDSSNIRLLQEASIHEIRSAQPSTAEPTKWATKNTTADSVTILMDTLPQSSYTLHADGWTSLSDLSGSDEPVIPKSYHDILTWFSISEELLRKGQDKPALIYETKAEKLLSQLRFHLNDSPTRDLRQNDSKVSISGTGSGGGGNAGTDAYTQSALITFDEDIAFSKTAWMIRAGTSDAADTKSLEINGGGATGLSRGSRLILGGNESLFPGQVFLQAGNVSGSHVSIGRGDGGTVIYCDGADGLIILGYGQVRFPAAQNPSTNANTLDDYEEGSWTITITGSGGSSGQVYSAQVGRYVKIGKKATAWGRVTLSTLGTITGTVQIAGLPFTSANTLAMPGSCYFSAMTSSYVTIVPIVTANTTGITLYGATAAATGLSTLAQADLSATTDLLISVTYETAV